VSITFERPPDDSAAALALLDPGGLSSSAPLETAALAVAAGAVAVEAVTSTTLAALPLGARLVVCCRKDWRTATVVRIEPDKITLSVSSPNGRTYRLRRTPDASLTFDGDIPLLGTTGHWRNALARYDTRW
jgi:hypothetical protein